MTETSTYAVEVSAVERRFGDTTAVAPLDLRLGIGAVHGLIGPNGSGKTTLLRMIAGLLEPTTGTVSVLGGHPSQMSVRRQIGWVSSGDRTFYLRISGFENLLFFGRLYGIDRREARRRALDRLELLGLGSAAHRPAGQYSKGMLKRLGLARALLADPSILLVDEATHDLDPAGVEIVRSTVRAAASTGTTTVWATQRLEELPGLVDTVTVLRGARPPLTSPLDDFLGTAPSRRFAVEVDDVTSKTVDIHRLLGDRGQVLGLEGSRTVIEVAATSRIGAVLRSLEEGGARVVWVGELETQIQEAFRAATGDGS